MKGIVLSTLFIFFLLITSGCIHPAGIQWEYRGKVINQLTGEPVEGMVVLGVWYTVTPTAAGAVSNFYDARETLTDKTGEFSLPGMGLKKLGNLDMHIWIFKAGYEYFGGPWNAYKEGIAYGAKTKWEDNKLFIPFKKLTTEERKKQGTPSRPNIPGEKMKLLTNEINKERTQMGLTPFSNTR